MPIITTEQLLDMNAFGREQLAQLVSSGQSVSTTATRAELLGYDQLGYEFRVIFTGTNLGGFTASGFPTTGVITGFRLEQGGDLVFGIASLSVQASALNSALTANDSTALWNLLYGGDDTITGGDTFGRGNTLFGHGGADTINGGIGGDWLNGGAGDDIIYGGDETDPTGASYGDGIDGGAGNDTLYGGAGRDVIVGGDGADLIEGGDGNDILYHDGDGITGTEVNFVYTQQPFPPMNIPVRAFLAGDRRAEDGAADTLNGGAGDDFIYLGIGDSADGGAGNDTVEVNFRGRTSALILDMSGSAAAALSAVSGGTYVNIERFDVVGSQFNDVIVGGADASILSGDLGEDSVDGGGGGDSVTGSAFTVSSRINGVWGSRFDDGQRDTLFGGEGNDGVSVGLLDVADGGAGTDTLLVTLDGMTQGVNLDLTTGDRFAAIAALTGGSYVNFETIGHLHTTEFDDVIRGLGVASIYTFGGNDTVYGDDINNTLGLGDGDDLAYGMGGNDLILGGFGSDRLYGGAGSDTIYADVDYDPTQSNGSGADFLDGGEGNDTLYGGAGDDMIIGGVGADRLFGESGFDTASYQGSTAGVSVQRIPNGMDPTTGEQAYMYLASGGDAQGDTLTSIEAVIGSDHNDRLLGFQSADGGAGNDALDGTRDADVLLGGAGDDTLAGFEGDDTLNGGQGMDIAEYSRLSFGAGSSGVTVDLRIQGTAQNTGAAGFDTLISIEGAVGTINADIIHGDDQANFIQGAGDGIQPGSGPYQGDQLFGHGGDDIIIGDGAAPGLGYAPGDGNSRGYDVIWGGDGNDTITAGNGGDVVYGEAGDDTIYGEWDADTLDGGAGNDVIDGGSMNDIIKGGEGADRLIGGSGDDNIDGGEGIDTAVFSGARSAYTISTVNGVTTVNGPDGVDVLTGVERLQFSDGLFAPDGGPLPNEVYGTPNADILNGTAGADIIAAGDGDDVITGGAGNDVIDGGAGVDTAVFAAGVVPYSVTVSNGVVTVVSSEGVDTLTNVERLRFGATEFSVSALGNGATALIGASSGDTLTGGVGDDLLIGGAGNDVLNGGSGVDTADYSGAAAGVTARIDLQSASNDGDGGSDTFTSIENLTGSAFNDLLIGDANANILVGGAGRDVLLGGGGDDLINGGADVPNELYGGAGNDTYIVENRSDSIFENAGEGIDTVLTAVSQITLAANIENLTYTGTGTFTGVGNAVNNVITGGIGRDVLLGLAGDDILIGGAGAANELYGGAGNDTYVLDVADSIIEGAGDGIDTVQLRGLRNYTLGSNVENGTVIGTGDFMLNGNALDNVLTGGDGNDTLQGGAGNDTLNGGAGIDTVTYILSTAGVTARLDLGRATNDGLGGTDTFTGFENLTGSNLRDTLMGDAGNNVIDGAIGNDVLLGFDGDDILIGGSGGGVNEMYGGRGNDLYIVDAADTLIELAGEGIDTVQTTMGNFTLKANIEHLTYVGPGNFGGTGNAEANTITGGAGHDTLAGLGGDDTLIGGAGNDLALLQGVRANYSFTQIEGGWRVVDSVAGRDGTDTLQGIESVRFANGEVLVLSSLLTPAATPEVMALLSDKILFDDAFVLPALPDDEPLVLPGLVADKDWADLPQVLPTADDLFAGDVVMDVVAPAYVPLHGHADGFGEALVRDWMV